MRYVRDRLPRGVFEISHKKAMIADRDSCIECGACARNCP